MEGSLGDLSLPETLAEALAEAKVPNGPGDCSISMDSYRRETS